ncbi:EamA family transporter [Hyphomicrobium sp.]|uniref:EamA family transporter n=1 Tax=Hyphomicrobium sp. TaxID=82 RepID=UPI003F6FD5D6
MRAAPDSLSLRDALLALAVTAVWGSNFVVIYVGLEHLPPLLFAALRFTFALLPAVLFLKRPAVPWLNLAAYGVFVGAGQFGLLYTAMHGMITPGLASLVVQTQVFFTVLLAAMISRERLGAYQVVALAIAFSGLLIILQHTDATTTLLGLALVLAAAASWALSNIIVRSTPNVDMLAYVVWGSLFAPLPLFALSFAFEGWPAIQTGLTNSTVATWASVAWQSFANTLFGYAVWSALLSRYPVATIAPMSLLVPIFGMGASAVWLGEPLDDWKLWAAAFVMCGLALNLLWPRLRKPVAA